MTSHSIVGFRMNKWDDFEKDAKLRICHIVTVHFEF